MTDEQLIPDDLRRTLLLSIKVCMGYKPKETAQWMRDMERAQEEATVAKQALPPDTEWEDMPTSTQILIKRATDTFTGLLDFINDTLEEIESADS